MMTRKVQAPHAQPGEREVKIPLHTFGHFDVTCLATEAMKAGITTNYVGYRLKGHEYRQDQHSTYAVLVFALIDVPDPNNLPDHWAMTTR